MLIYKNNPTLPQGGPDIGLKVGILAEIGNMLHECALGILYLWVEQIFTPDMLNPQKGTPYCS